MKATKNANGAARVAIQAKMSELDTAIAEASEYKRKHYATQRKLLDCEDELSVVKTRCAGYKQEAMRLGHARRNAELDLNHARRVSEQRLVHCQNLAESEHNLRERLGYAIAASWIGWLTAFGFLGDMILKAL